MVKTVVWDRNDVVWVKSIEKAKMHQYNEYIKIGDAVSTGIACRT
jgi:hypothetical protein